MEYSDIEQLQKLIQQRGQTQAASMVVKPLYLNRQTSLMQIQQDLNKQYNFGGANEGKQNELHLDLEDDGEGGITNEEREY